MEIFNASLDPVGKVAWFQCFCCKLTIDVRTGKFFSPVESWLVSSNFRCASCMQGNCCTEKNSYYIAYRAYTVHYWQPLANSLTANQNVHINNTKINKLWSLRLHYHLQVSFVLPLSQQMGETTRKWQCLDSQMTWHDATSVEECTEYHQPSKQPAINTIPWIIFFTLN